MEFKKLEKRVFVLSGLTFLLAAIFSTGYHHFDEHFQILEFAGLKLGLTEAQNLPWEFKEQMRPAIQPAITVCLYKLCSAFGVSNPFSFTFVTRIISAILSFIALICSYKLFKNEFTQPRLKKWFLYLSFFFWLIIYNGVRYSSENWSELFFLFSVLLYFIPKEKKHGHYIAIGALMGISFLFRYQTAFMTIGFFAWMLLINKEKVSKLSSISLGVILAIAFGIIIDRWFYGEWVLSSWNYFEQNLILGKSKHFGVEPWYWYFTQAFLQGVPPISVLMITGVMSFLVLFRRKAFTWIIIPFLFVHLAVAHKEIRFLFPLIFTIPYAVTKVLQATNTKWPTFIENKAFIITMKMVLLTNYLFLLVITFKPADNHIALYQKLYSKYHEPTTLYYLDKNPYLRVLDIHFYKRDELQIIQIKNINEIHKNTKRKSLIVFTNKNKPEGFAKEHDLIYKSFPDWMSHFNFNNWMRRSKSWYVYEL